MSDKSKKKTELIAEIEKLRKENARLNKKLKNIKERGEINNTEGESEKGLRSHSGLERKNEVLRAIIDSSPFAIVGLNLQNKVTMWNPVAEQIFGWKEKEIIGKIFPLVPEYKTGEHSELKKILLENGTIKKIESIRKKKDNSLITVALSSAPIKSQSNEIIGFMTVYDDITELRLTEQKFKTMFDSMIQGVVYQNSEGKLIDMNSAAERILGKNFSELKNKSLFTSEWKAVNESRQKITVKKLPAAEALHKGREIKDAVIGIFNTKLNSYRWLNITSVPLYKTGAETPYGVYSIFDDITDKRNTLEALINTQKKNEVILDTIPDSFFIISKRGEINDYKIESNYSLLSKLQSVKNKNINDVLPAKVSRVILSNIGEVLKTGKMNTVEIPIKLSGVKTVQEVRIVRLSGEETLIITRDISERINAKKRLEDYKDYLETLVEQKTNSLKELNKKLEKEIKKQKESERLTRLALEKEKELNELKTRFISMASHEYRTPLTAIKIYADILKMKGNRIEESKFNGYIDNIEKSIGYMVDLISDVLTVSKAEAKKLPYNGVEFDFPDFINSVLDQIRDNNGKKHLINFNYAANIRQIYSDKNLLTQIISNLVTNAIKYSAENEPVEVEAGTEGEKIFISVSDNGIGIPEKDQPNLFEAFHRGSNVGTIPGTGLGLTIVQKSVELNGGVLIFKSKEGKGSTFKVFLPIKKKENGKDFNN